MEECFPFVHVRPLLSISLWTFICQMTISIWWFPNFNTGRWVVGCWPSLLLLLLSFDCANFFDAHSVSTSQDGLRSFLHVSARTRNEKKKTFRASLRLLSGSWTIFEDESEKQQKCRTKRVEEGQILWPFKNNNRPSRNEHFGQILVEHSVATLVFFSQLVNGHCAEWPCTFLPPTISIFSFYGAGEIGLFSNNKMSEALAFALLSTLELSTKKIHFVTRGCLCERGGGKEKRNSEVDDR